MAIRTGEEGYQFTIEATPDQIREAKEPFDDLMNEVPDYDDLFSCLINAGIVRYVNQAEFEQASHAHKGLKKDVYYGLDTNLFYHGFPSRSGIDPAHFAVLDITKAEIESLLNNKYSAPQIATFKQKARFQKQMLDELINQRTRRARLATYLALREFQTVRDRALRIEAGESISADKERNDLIIVQAFRRFESEKFSLPVLLTADKNVATLCEAEGVEYFLFQVPYTFAEKRCTANQMVQLLYNLATVFGFIQCGGLSIYGEFRGKGPDLEELKIVLQNSRMEIDLRKDLAVCRKLLSLPIEK
ncbi:MAG: PIN domain-containing protein [Methanomicrobiales archaeon]|nr:PIN domain-containing protein [Methanomicrobiales archaeon]